ncbi:MAG: orotidine 5'-phosphate decarboxylase [Candidatus Liptonbacteria bacterium RIFCSPHIGHO2_01_FULL_57_28]|uniref:Orotidine-5'-phosphate decarboxylase n=1 Tax=Candidatus Liptonbacteria bacterium RIFCSPHIGHO2_01_FULL_57_28 TaxID=1798647 RepID=A0A1G2CBB7_9BACT|nr:MAG: orotidine 5'-phosphate decarboxylase [Candidatus Liptonbacteria bacterium RIFCSPHIGHO2_01_FULL_57_28]
MNGVQKYEARADKINSLLCVGLDAEFEKLPERFRSMAEPQFEFNKYIIEATHEHAAAYKPNIAFYEARGAGGMAELEHTIIYLRDNHPDIFTICDAKRSEIGNSMEQYAQAIFDRMGFDACTVNPYLGREACEPFLKRADKIAIVLCRTSNPGAGDIQDLQIGEKLLWRVVAEKVRHEWNHNGNCMLVVGATYPAELRTLRAIMGKMTFLVPGFGAQGGDVEKAVRAGLNSTKKGMIINSSRGIIFAKDPGTAAKKLKEEVNQYR